MEAAIREVTPEIREAPQGEPMAAVLLHVADRPHAVGRSGGFGRVGVHLDPALLPALQALGGPRATPTASVLLAAFATLLHRYSGEAMVPVGVLAAAASEGLRLVRCDLGEDPPFAHLVERVTRAAVEEAAVRIPGPPPLLFTFAGSQNGSSAAGEPAPARLPPAGCDLALTLAPEEGGGLAGELVYSADLFDAATVRRMTRHFLTLLEGAAATPRARLSELPLLEPAERHQIALEWSRTAEVPPPDCLHDLVVRQVERTPEAVALVAGLERVSYGELDRRSGHLARHLQALGVAPEVRVGVAMERRPEVVVAFLAVLRAGGAYVPVDPAYPTERVALMLEDRGLVALLTRRRVLARLAAAVPEGLPTLCVEDLAAAPDAGGEELAGALPGNLAYVLYTSGSSGRPKPVAVEHRSPVALVRWARDYFGERLAGTLAVTSICFDLSVFELFAPLCSGGEVILADSLLQLRTLPALAEVTLVNTAPSVVADQLRREGIPASVGAVSLAGEALPGPLVEELYGAGVARVFNLYGPTEDTTYSTYALIPRGSSLPPAIGRPVAGGTVQLLDRRRRLVPAGMPGEICLGGAGLARGYLGRPALTADHFIPDPAARRPGDRLYRTGDLGRLRPDGDLEFLGRIDHQLKIRGCRIEPGEVEATLAGHPRVARAAVVAARSGAGEGDVHLVAYLVPAAPPAPGAAELRSYLGGRLPIFMVPAIFFALPELPLSPNGKVDRAALARRALPASVREGLFVSPRTPVEEVVARVFGELLGRERVGAHDDFFALGGHSLLGGRALVRLRGFLGVELPLAALFQAPTPALLARRIEAAQEREIPGGRVVPPPLLPVSLQGAPPASYAQERMWFLDRLVPESCLYNIPGLLRLAGALEVAALERALAVVVERHEALRTTLQAGEEGPVQVIAPSRPALPLPVVDLSGLPRGSAGTTFDRLAEGEARRPFDLARGPLLRAALVRLFVDHHRLLASFHHSVADGWSLELFVQELTELYSAITASLPSPLPELPVQYADFAVWQRRWLTGQVLEGQLGYWRRRLAGLEPLELPADRPRPPQPSYRGGRVPVAFSPALTRGLEGLSSERGATPFMALLATFQALLFRLTGQRDLAVGSPVANRTQVETEGLIGFFVNTLVLRTEVAGEGSFLDLLEQVKEVALAAYAHQELPFEKLVAEIRPERSLARTPLFQVMFALQNLPGLSRELPGLEVALEERFTGTAKFDLGVSLETAGGGLAGWVEYASDLFDPTTVRRLVRHWQILLAAVVAAPERCLSELPLLSPPERQQLLVENNDTTAAFPGGATVHQLFRQVAAATPEAVALVSLREASPELVSYGELDRRSDHLARRLRSAGVGVETPVALYLERSDQVVLGQLAVLKAGGLYLPLDESYPPARLAAMIEEARPAALLARDGELPGELAAEAPPILDPEAAEAGEAAREPLPSEVAPGNLAYLMYTSGSTGRPKGIGVPHRGIVRLVRGVSYARFGAGEVILQLAPTSFDAATCEIWAALLHGARLVLFPRRRPSLEELGRTVKEQRITTLFLTTGLFHVMVEERLDDLREIRQLLTGGDVISPPHVARVWSGMPRGRLVACYGPTEGTTFTSCHSVRQARPDRSVPIGRPIANTTVYVADRRLRSLPLGIPGELLIGGLGLARGYLGQPARTAESFIPDALSGGAGGRLYRSGDRVRWLSEGELEFQGRIDDQVKIRGFRIEPGEVAAVLAAHPEVAEAVVVVRDDLPAGKGLVAYAVPEDGAVPGAGWTARLQEHLAAKLPEYMVPQAVVVLESLPLTPNGKIDRRALPAPGLRVEGASAPPRSPVEEMVAGLWAELLGTGPVGIHDDFFALGGHSLLATQVLSRLRRLLGVELPVTAIFQAPTVAGLAERVEAARACSRGAEPPALVPVPREGELPLSFAQQRLWFVAQLTPGSPVYNIPGPLLLEGELDAAALARTLSAIVERHEALRTTFASRQGEPHQVVQPARPLPLPAVDLSGLAEPRRGELLRELARREGGRPFDLERGPMARSTLVRLAAREHGLLLCFHHIAADGWSVGVFVREMGALYEAFTAGRPSPLPPLPVQYPDYAVWQRRWLAGQVLDEQLAYWRRQLADLPRLELPTDRPRPAQESFRGTYRIFDLAPELSAAVQAFSRRGGATLFMTLLAATQALLARYTGQDRVPVGTPIANRSRLEVEGLIGFFVNTLVMATDLTGRPSFQQAVERVREVTLGAYDHQDAPFERLLEALQTGRDPSQQQLFQVLFAVADMSAQEALRLPGLVLSLLEIHTDTAKFDLSLSFVREQEGGLRLWIEYATDLFDEATILRMGSHLQTLLDGALREPDRPLAELPLLSPAESRELAARAAAAAARLRRHPGVREVEVVADEDQPGRRRLLAWTVPAGRPAPDPGELFGEQPPGAPEPPLVVFLERLPRTPAGSLDREALPAPFAAAGPAAGADPAQEREAKLAAQKARLEEKREQLSDKRRALLARWLQGKAAGKEARPAIPRRSQPGPAPLSFAQQRLWFLDRLTPGLPIYNIPAAVRLEGRLDRRALAASLAEIVRRHESLRTTFVELEEGASGSRPVQVVGPARAPRLPLVDLSELPDGARRAEALRLARREARRPFDLERGPLLRSLLLALGREEHILVATQHHIVSDGWSMGLFFKELVALYRAYAAGGASPLPEPPLQYGDFAAWQREELAGEKLEQQLAFWRHQLEGAPTVLELPTDRPRSTGQSFRGGAVSFRVPPEVTRRLQELGHRREATPFMILLAAFAVLLHRHSSQREVVVGTPIAGRKRSELEGLIGFFVNTLAIRCRLGEDPSFEALVDQVRETSLAAFGHQELPFERLVQELAGERDLGRNPLFQVAFALQSALIEPLTLPGLSLQPVTLETETAKFDLTLDMTEREGGLDGWLEYNADLFDATTAVRMVGHLGRLLSAAAREPGRPVSDLSLLQPAERHTVLYEDNDTRVDYPAAATLHELFRRQAAVVPEAVALVASGGVPEHLSYGEVERRSDFLAERLRALGVGVEVPVALYLRCSPRLVVGLLGVLKAGGYYLPLDESSPPARLAATLEEARPGALLIRDGVVPAGAGTGLPVLDLAAGGVAGTGAGGGGQAPPPASSGPDNLAYLMYTSGSTGKPKGIGVSHRSVIRLVQGVSYARFGGGEVFLQLAPTSFDAATFEIWGSLLHGARLILAPSRRLSLEELGRLVQEQRLTTLWITSGLFHLMVDERLADLRGLSQLLSGGDVLSPAHVARVRRELPSCRVVNAYGPTEGTTFTTCFPVPAEVTADRLVPIGRPIANTRVYVVSPRLRLSPMGVPGELVIGGVGLARGYLGQPARTARRFVPDPSSSELGGRLYLSGDRVRRLSGGELEFHGRIDDQVKIRGFRVEPGEVAAVLEAHPEVAEAVVVVRSDLATGKGLVAYAVPREDAVAAATEAESWTSRLREYLETELPEYMVPSAFMVLETLPLTPNGKVDRQALPTPAAPRLAGERMAPRNAVEEVLAALWAEALGLPEVGVQDEFFQLGGHSLLATQLVSQIRKMFKAELPLRSFFEATTVERLARTLVEHETEPGRTEKVARLILRVKGLSADQVTSDLSARRRTG